MSPNHFWPHITNHCWPMSLYALLALCHSLLLLGGPIHTAEPISPCSLFTPCHPVCVTLLIHCVPPCLYTMCHPAHTPCVILLIHNVSPCSVCHPTHMLCVTLLIVMCHPAYMPCVTLLILHVSSCSCALCHPAHTVCAGEDPAWCSDVVGRSCLQDALSTR